MWYGMLDNFFPFFSVWLSCRRNFSIIAHIGAYFVLVLQLMLNKLEHRPRQINISGSVSAHSSLFQYLVLDSWISIRLLEVCLCVFIRHHRTERHHSWLALLRRKRLGEIYKSWISWKSNVNGVSQVCRPPSFAKILFTESQVKAQTARYSFLMRISHPYLNHWSMLHTHEGRKHLLNLIDTPVKHILQVVEVMSIFKFVLGSCWFCLGSFAIVGCLWRCSSLSTSALSITWWNCNNLFV